MNLCTDKLCVRLLSTAIFGIAGCNNYNSAAVTLPQSEEEVKAFLAAVVESSQDEIHRANSEFVFDQGGEPEGLFDGVTILPKRVSLAKKGIGLVWERVVYARLNEDQIEAAKILFTPLDLMEDYCQPPVLDWMRDYDYFVIERLYARGNIFISETKIDLQECLHYIEMMSDP